jgi:hypothetical protein
MPAASNTELPKSGFGDETSAEWGEMIIDFAKFPPFNLAPLLKGLPDDRCQCPHWGYLFKGKIVVRYADHEEIIQAGQAFYMPPGHAPEALEACEIMQFSPSAAHREQPGVGTAAAPASLRPYGSPGSSGRGDIAG